MSVKVISTPNPDACMYRVQETLIPTGTFEFFQGDDLSYSPLAQRLMKIEDVELILIAPRFVTVRKDPTANWEKINEQVISSITDFLDSGEMAVIESKLKKSTDVKRTEIEKKIIILLDEEVRPAIAQDGGDLIYHGFDDGIVKLELIGACSTCPSSTATLQFGIQNLLMEEFEEVEGVEQV